MSTAEHSILPLLRLHPHTIEIKITGTLTDQLSIVCKLLHASLQPLLCRVCQSLPQVKGERAPDHDTVTKRCNVPDDNR